MPATLPNPDDEPPRRGRRTKLTDALFRAFIELFLKGSYRETACRELGIDYCTFSRWMKRGKKEPGTIFAEFRQGVMSAESRAQNRLLDRVQTAALEDWKAAAWVLERKFPDLFGAYRGELGELKRQVRELERELAKVPVGATQELPDQETH